MTRLSLLRCAVVALLVACTSALALGGADETPGRLQPASASEQPLRTVDAGLQAVSDPGQATPPITIAPVLPSPPKAQAADPPARRTPAQAPPSAVPRARAKPTSKPAAPSGNVTRCAQYNRGGSVHPLCKSSAGTSGDVAVETVPGTNVTVNKAWAANVKAFFGAARAAGFDLAAWDVAGPGYGSFRTPAMQQDLRRRGYPANPPGMSMHEWGLAIDLSCNGAKFMDASAPCRDWVRANAGRFGISNLPSEPWHWSSNGR